MRSLLLGLMDPLRGRGEVDVMQNSAGVYEVAWKLDFLCCISIKQWFLKQQMFLQYLDFDAWHS